MASTQITKIIGTRTLSVCNRSLATCFFTRNQRFHTSARSQLPDGPIPRKHERLLGDVHSRGIGVLRDPRFNKVGEGGQQRPCHVFFIKKYFKFNMIVMTMSQA